MFQLTNEQRRCFGLTPVEADLELRALPRSKYDNYDSFVYVKENRIYKLIQQEEKWYCEYSLDETLSEDGVYILPKTAKGKPQKLTAASISKKTRVGMAFEYYREYNRRNVFNLFNSTSQQDFYSSYAYYTNEEELSAWVEKWCAETGEAELADITEFAARQRVNVKFREGDFFRFRINRKLWGYGRVLFDYYKAKIKGGVTFMGRPVLISFYHIATEDKNVSIDTLCTLKRTPSGYIMDNKLFYGEYEIIGNKPLLDEEKDFPLHYRGDTTMTLQCGHFIKVLENSRSIDWLHEYKGRGVNRGVPPSSVFCNIGVGFYYSVRYSILLECIKQNSNMPYWNQDNAIPEEDLRNPRYAAECRAVFEQFGLNEEDFIKKDIQK